MIHSAFFSLKLFIRYFRHISWNETIEWGKKRAGDLQSRESDREWFMANNETREYCSAKLH